MESPDACISGEELKLPHLFPAPFAYTPVSHVKRVQRPAAFSSSSYDGEGRQSGHEGHFAPPL